MYHDEFAPRSVRDRGDVGGAYTGLAVEIGGGVSAAVACAMVLPEMPLLLAIGGLFPLVACCLALLVERGREGRSGLLQILESWRLGGRRALAHATGGRPRATIRGPRFAAVRARAVGAGFDRSRRLG